MLVEYIFVFQYNCCFGGIQWLLQIQTIHPCFNTTVVSVELKKSHNFKSDTKAFQYNCCFGGIVCFYSKSLFFLLVSIQLLFRWNLIYFCNYIFNRTVSIQLLFRWNFANGYPMVLTGFAFQYNCCFGGIARIYKYLYCKALFQYNCCFGGIMLVIGENNSLIKFQYNCCFGGI